jgi:hypothetical protein
LATDGSRSNGEVPRKTRVGSRNEYLELWINLARREWHSLVVIPADGHGSTADVAQALAEIGQRLSFGPVTALTLSALEYGSALALADLQQHIHREREKQVVAAGPAAGEPAPDRAASPPPSPASTPGPANGAADGNGARKPDALMLVPPARLIISVPPVISEPLGLTAAAEADAIVLAVRMNHSRMAEVRRTIQLVGRDRIAGCFLVH